MKDRRRTVLWSAASLLVGSLVGGALVWTLTGAGESGEGLGRAALDAPDDSFTLSGELTELLSPGIFAPLNLSITNTNDNSLIVSDIVVTVSPANGPSSTEQLPCSPDDFDVQQIEKPYALEIAAGTTLSLADAGLDESEWPHVGMPLDDSTNQDGCKHVSLSLSYTAVGQVVE